MECVNLKQQFGDRYKVEFEESYFAQYGPNARTEDPWYMVIRCQRAVQIFPWDQSTLAVSTETETPASWIDALMQIPSIRIHQAGADGFTLLFDVEHFDQVAEIVKPRKRRPKLSEDCRRKLREAGIKYQFTHGSHDSKRPRRRAS